MKVFTLAACFAFLLGAAQAMNAQSMPPVPDRQAAIIRTNVLAGLDHPVIEVRASYIQLVIEMKKAWPASNFNYAIIPLMGRLKSDECPEVRILAALALQEFDTNMGKFAVSRRALYDESPRVARHCSMIARLWHKGQNAAETPLELAAAIFR